MKQTILLVEDSKLQKLACERVLYRAGYLVLYAADGEEGLRLAQESVPDLILLDLLLPGIGGEEVLYALKRNLRTESIPVVVLSSLPATKSVELKAAGAADYFEKGRLTDQADGETAFLATIESVLCSVSDRQKHAGKHAPFAAGHR
jgi:DNA-binding response OmpR family regulator